jgi:hypothetical protein
MRTEIDPTHEVLMDYFVSGAELEKEIKSCPNKAILFLLIIMVLAAICPITAQTNRYQDWPRKAEFSVDGAAMNIGGKAYRVYNAFSPIAPKGGERVEDYAGVLDYYAWFHKGPDGGFTMSKIDMELNIYYYDEQTGEYINPVGNILKN